MSVELQCFPLCAKFLHKIVFVIFMLSYYFAVAHTYESMYASKNDLHAIYLVLLAFIANICSFIGFCFFVVFFH